MDPIEYFYAGYSGYAYLGSRRFMEIAKAAGRAIRHRPFDLRYLLDHNGSQPFDERSEAYGAYHFVRQIERWSEYRNMPVARLNPTHHGNTIDPSNKMLIAAVELGHNIDQLSCIMMEQHWRYDVDLADLDTLQEIARLAGLDPAPLMERLDANSVQATYDANTAEAVKMGLLGSPTYIVDGDMFYGQDHLSFIERALDKPFTLRIPD